jgi:F0F1-type ATP synthase membrane subunit c/vacuolar-type H+-ATPase subunit K
LQPKPDIDHLYRTLLIVWLVFLLSQLALFGLSWSIGGEAAQTNVQYGFLGPYPPVIYGALFLAGANFAISIVLRRVCDQHAVAEQNVKHVQTGLIIGCGLCESISLIGMVLLFAFAYPFFFYWFAIGILGIFLHFPRRQKLLDASAV